MGRFPRHCQNVLVGALLCVTALAPVASQPQAPPSPTISFRIIVVESQDAAERVLEQLKNGENIVALAARISVDRSASRGGLVGPVPISELRPEIRNASNGKYRLAHVFQRPEHLAFFVALNK